MTGHAPRSLPLGVVREGECYAGRYSEVRELLLQLPLWSVAIKVHGSAP